MLIRRGFLLVGALPFRQVPDFKTTPPADQRDLAFQAELAAHIYGQDETTLPVRAAVLGARMEMAQKNPALLRGNRTVSFGLSTHAIEFPVGHDEEKLMLRFGQDNEVLATLSAPTRRNRDTVLLVKGVAEFAGEEFLGLELSSMRERNGVPFQSTSPHF